MTPADSVPAVVIRAAEGERITAAGIEHLFKLTGGTTGGLIGLEVFAVEPGSPGARPHIHHGHDEYFYVTSGELTVITGEGESRLGPGDMAQAPRGSIHGYRNDHAATEARGLCLFTPAGYEQYFRDVHAAALAGAVIDDDVLARLREPYATESL